MLNGIMDDSRWNNNVLKDSLNKSSQKNGDYAKKIVLANKGEMGYFAQMDLNRDGIITLDEFNQYCEENSIGDEEKQKLFEIMQMGKTIDALKKEINKSNEENDETQAFEDKSIYAKKGDDKYDEKMDENKDSKITYKEYMDYCAKYANSKDEKQNSGSEPKPFKVKNAIDAYNKKQTQEAQIQVESEA